MLMLSSFAIVSVKSSGEASAGTLILIRQPGSVPRLIFEYSDEMIFHGQLLRSFTMLALQIFAAAEAFTSAMNWRFDAESSAMMAGVANRGCQSAALFVVKEDAEELKS